MIGETVSHYRVLEELGGGAMGVVYKAQDTRLKRLVALKFLPTELTKDADAKRRFVQEAETASALDHPNVCTIYDIDETADGRVFIAMAFYEGETLRRRMQRGSSSIDEVVSIAGQVAGALQAAHDAGIVHRDVKPANIMVTSRGEVKLVDFGIAKLAGHADLTQTGSSVGTVGYMAPEQFEGQVDARADIWSLGVVIYEMLVGRRPFEGTDAISTMNAVFHHQPPPLSALRDDVPTALAAVVDRALQKKPADRYGSAKDMAAGINACRPRVVIEAPSPLRTIARPIVAVPVLLVVGALVYLLVTNLIAQSQTRWAREEALPEIARLVQSDENHRAYTLAQAAGRYIPNDPALATLMSQMTAPPPFVVTRPATARVHARAYGVGPAEWRLIGTGSIDGVRLPHGAYLFRIEADGFETVEIARNVNQTLAKPIPIELPVAGSLRKGTVAVGAGRGPVDLTGFATEDAVSVPAFAVDRYEVTNREFKEFVDAGGYDRRELWNHPVQHNGRRLSWAESKALFRDSSGRPGPATWELGNFRDGQADHPVNGVSWYEAAAYAEFKGAALPTIYHWARAALADTRPAPIRGVIVKASNYSGNELMPVGATGAMGPFGTFDMAGNVREWCVNESGANRWVLGGAIGDGEHFYVVPYSLPPTDRSPTNGMRLAYYDTKAAADLAKPIQVFRRDFRGVKPVSDEVFAIFKRQLMPVPSPVDAQIESRTESADWVRELLSIDTGLGDRMKIVLFLPKARPGRRQVVVLFPSLAPFINSTMPLQQTPCEAGSCPDYLVKSGRILALPVWKGSGDRFDGFVSVTGDRYLQVFRERMREWAQEQSQLLDYLSSRSDVDPAGFSYLGGSFGASTNLPIIAMEPRYKAVVLYAGGLPYRSLPPEVDAVNFVGRIMQPVLMLEARYDHLFPVDTSQQPMFNLLGAPADRKRMVLFDAGHGALPRGQVINETLTWLDRFVGPSQ